LWSVAAVLGLAGVEEVFATAVIPSASVARRTAADLFMSVEFILTVDTREEPVRNIQIPNQRTSATTPGPDSSEVSISNT
jgi:hypothetical protein